MKIKIEEKNYETGKFSPSILKRVIEAQKVMENAGDSVEETMKAFDHLADFICLLLISGTEKIPYRLVKLEQIEELKPIIEDNFDFLEIVSLFADIMKEITGVIPQEGKPIVA